MKKRTYAMLLAGIVALSAAACSAPTGTDDTAGQDTAETAMDETDETGASADDADETDASTEETDTGIGSVDNTLAQDTDALVSDYADKFEQIEYTDSETGLSVTYNLFLPENYDEESSYPTVVFIADSSCTGEDATRSLTQGRGALVWASDAWQSVNPSIVVVPSYPETILDDHNGYSTTEYVELTKRLIDDISEEYAVDTDRIYGTGQSMGCMTTLILASEYPDLYAGCMFVDGQWDVSTLSSLENQKFVYFAAEDDTSAFNGMSELMESFDNDNAIYSYEQWDGSWTCDELSEAANLLFAKGTDANFISWKTGTIEVDESMGGGGPQGGRSEGEAPEAPNGDKPEGEAPEAPNGGKPEGEAPEAPNGGNLDGEAPNDGNPPQMPQDNSDGNNKNGGNGGMGGASYHMASFNYAYNCIAVMEWLFQ